MKISYKWLQDFVDIDILGLDAEELAEALTLVGLAVETIEEVDDDLVFDIEVTTNRSDCLSHLGVAREIAARYRLKLHTSDFSASALDESRMSDFPVKIDIEEPELCPRYVGQVITGIRIADSPNWLIERLEAVGQRPLNNIVDITNYVLFELGHPLHAFDYDLLQGRQIVVRSARPGESLSTLDGIERALDHDMLMICDAVRPVAVAGVMGGEESEISSETQTILLESAYFNPESIRATSRRLGLSTEASYRFERGADPEMPVKALNLASRMIAEICGGTCVSPVLDENPRKHQRSVLRLRSQRIEKVLGVPVDLADARQILTHLEFTVREAPEASLEVTVPGFRSDITIEDDLVEEIARHVGYESIPSRYPAPVSPGSYSTSVHHDRVLTRVLVGLGFYEAVNYSFTTPAREEQLWGRETRLLPISNPLSEMDTHLRTTLLPGLIECAKHNLNHGLREVCLFETGRVFQPGKKALFEEFEEKENLALFALGTFYDPFWTQEKSEFNFFHMKGVIESLLKGFGGKIEFTRLVDSAFLHPGVGSTVKRNGKVLGVVGELHPRLAEIYKFAQKAFIAELSLADLYNSPLPEPRFTSPPRYPAVERDLCFFLDKDIEFNTIISAVQALEIRELLQLRLIDLYQGSSLSANKISLTVRLTFSDADRTLTQNEVNACFDRVAKALGEKFGVVLR